MAKTHAQSFLEALEGNSDVLPVKLHADSLAVGSVVEINTATGVTSAPADNDDTGFFGVLLKAGDTDDIVPVQVSGRCKALTGDTSAVGNFVVPMADYMLNIQPSLSLTGEAQTVTPKPAFAKLLEAGVAGELKLIQIVSQ